MCEYTAFISYKCDVSNFLFEDFICCDEIPFFGTLRKDDMILVFNSAVNDFIKKILRSAFFGLSGLQHSL